MVLCRFFLEGFCKYGQRCKFKHAYYEGRDNYYGHNDQGYYRDQSRQSNAKGFSGVSILRSGGGGDNPSFTPIQNPSSGYHSSNYNQSSGFGGYANSNYNSSSNNNHRNSSQTSLNQELLVAILKELDASENGHQWPLSCCCPVIKETVNIPGWIDHSPEELRWEVYKNSKDENAEQCKVSIQQLFREAQDKRNEFKSREKALSIIETMLEMKRTSSNTFSNTATSNAFAAPNSAFTASSNVHNPIPAFGSTTQTQPQPFPQPFENSQPQSFAPASQSRLFFDPAPSFSFSLNNAATSNAAAAAAASSLPSVSTSAPPPIFNQAQFTQSNQMMFNGTSNSPIGDINQSNYSSLPELLQSELNSYQAGTFRFGEIPTKPPPKEFCF